MSAAGVYGVVSYTTSRRTQEIGIRMALGATPGDVFSLIFRQSFATAAIGLAIGACAAQPIMRALKSFLAGMEFGYGAYLCAAAAVVALTAGIACWIPARRATHADPMCALRQE
jgi:ABC-type antimicrobial peptide transport system permease subunit